MAVVRSVKNWKTLAKKLVSAYDDSDDIFILGSINLDDIQRRHSSDEDCLKEVVDTFLGQYRQHRRSWRMILLCLVMADERQLALHFKSYSEQLKGIRVSVYGFIQLH